MAYNKITLNGETKIDLTQDTVTAEDVALGKTFHLNSGEQAVGTLEISGGGDFFDTTFANNTPEQISKVSAIISYNNMTSTEIESAFGWKIGDTKDITLTTGETIQMRIIGFNHDNKSDGGKAGITLQMTHALATRYKMNNADFNDGGYPNSVLKKTTIPTIKNTLPQEWKDIIKLVKKKSANGGANNFTETLTTNEDLFVLSAIELFGKSIAESNAVDGANEGTQYEYWNGKSSANRIMKYDTNADGVPDKATTCWLRSTSSSAYDMWNVLYSDGGNNRSSASSSYGVPFAFCI